MVFSSNAFLLLFLPLFLLLYYLTPNTRRLRNYVVLAASYVFYGWWRPDFLSLLISVTLFNFVIGRQIGIAGARTSEARRWMRLGVAVDLAVLGYFKYRDFGIESFNSIIQATGFEPFTLSELLLPIGISFYIFESISYIIDVYRGSVKPTRHLADFATFITMFPHLIVGPLFRYKEMAAQLEHRVHSMDMFGRGAVRFMQGFVKKVVIADTLAPMVNYCFALPDPSTADVWIGVLAYGVQLYFDFSGYSDMAIGLGLMMGFKFVENFNKPFISQSVTEFWRRWHISLSNWLRDYVFYSLGGTARKTRMRLHYMTFMTFLIGGIWHGANWTFVLWGALQGGLLLFERMLGVNGNPTRFKFQHWALTFIVAVAMSMVLFRADNVSRAAEMYKSMLFFQNVGWISEPFAGAISTMQIATLILAYGLVIFEGLREYGPKIQLGSERVRVVSSVLLLTPLFFLAITKLSAQGYSAFLYFQF
ncbi:MAG: MBOAT family protein [Nevskia sp.]|nr:MBOAT family protein [Gammaproteobacteria bacterium]MDH4458416.1 MBOAT family protein [Nevskia sp.]